MSEQTPGNWAGRRDSAKRRSIVLRPEQTDEQAGGSLMDPATRSLAEALRITYRLLLGAIGVLIVLYIGSGLQTVAEGEVGIKVVFGRMGARDLGPGIHAGAPKPLGELVKVATGTNTLDVNRAFWPSVSDEELAKGAEAFQNNNWGADALDPRVDGSSITSDTSIVHTQWQASYVRQDPAKLVESINPDVERALVDAAVRRGVVHALSSLTIDEVLRNAPDPQRAPGTFLTAEELALMVAQDTLDRAGSGLRIMQLSLKSKTPARRTIGQFAAVEAARSTAGSKIESAERTRRSTLAKTAGEAAEPLLEMIERYEALLDTGRDEQASATLSEINAVLEGAPLGGPKGPTATGTVGAILAQAKSRRATIVSEASQKLDQFEAALESYRANPALLLKQRWRESIVTGFYSRRRSVEVQMLPESIDAYEFVLNRDPNLKKRSTFEQLYEQGQQVREKRMEDFDPRNRQPRPR